MVCFDLIFGGGGHKIKTYDMDHFYDLIMSGPLCDRRRQT